MAIQDHYMETLEVIHTVFKHIFTGLETRWKKELAIVREQYASEPVTFTEEPCVLHWPEGLELLQEAGFDVGDGLSDLTGAMVCTLGRQLLVFAPMTTLCSRLTLNLLIHGCCCY